MSTRERLERTIADLWERHSAHLSDLVAHEGRKGTSWWDDRMTLVRAIREQIRDREAMLDAMA